MISNEQRAHDLAIATLQQLLKTPSSIYIDGCSVDEKGNVRVDMFKMYINLYNHLLESMNKEFIVE